MTEGQTEVLGAALISGVGLGVFRDYACAVEQMVATGQRFPWNRTAHAAYDQVYAVYRDLYADLKPYFEREAGLALEQSPRDAERQEPVRAGAELEMAIGLLCGGRGDRIDDQELAPRLRASLTNAAQCRWVTARFLPQTTTARLCARSSGACVSWCRSRRPGSRGLRASTPERDGRVPHQVHQRLHRLRKQLKVFLFHRRMHQNHHHQLRILVEVLNIQSHHHQD
jgi:hypothetical protein